MSYVKIPTWLEKYPDRNVKLEILNVHDSWAPLIKKIFTERKKEIQKLEEMLQIVIEEKAVFPYPDNVFNALVLTHFNNIKVVILGQDPYIKSELHDKIYMPQAMGLSFSIPTKVKIPPSLVNIYDNLLRFGHIKSKPTSGNLVHWAEQGCLLLNASLTVTCGISNSHEKYWKEITDDIIRYISDNASNVVFFLWGGPALKKLPLIDSKKHKLSISSHPSPLGFKSVLNNYGSFYDTDHFGVANAYLKEHGKIPIEWTIL